MKNKFALVVTACFCLLTWSCTKESLTDNEPEVVKEWKITIAAVNVVPMPANRPDTGTVSLKLFEDNSLKFELDVKRLTNSDVIVGAQLKGGDPVTNGTVLINMSPVSKFPAANALGANGYGVVTGVRQSLVDSLLSATNHQLYFELTSLQLPAGMARGQLNERVQFAADVTMTGAGQVPPNSTSSVGRVWLRMTTERKLYSRISITNNALDPISIAHIHRAAVGFNGPIVQNLASSLADFDVSKTFLLDQATYNTIINDSRLYIDAHSLLFQAGKIRGQLRN